MKELFGDYWPNLMDMTDEQRENYWPNLKRGTFEKTSNDSTLYNCVAWAIGETNRWWEPDPHEENYWPGNVARIPTLEGFIEAFRTRNYEPCADGNFEANFEKIVIYANDEGKPLHVARQLPNNLWTSKMGDLEDIIHHTLECLEGLFYGRIVQFMRRPTQ